MIKIGILGDLHLTDKGPEKRIDDFFAAQVKKMEYIFNKFEEEKVDFILQPGDFFDSTKVSDFVKQFYITWFRDWDIPIYVVLGQHDMRYHTNSPFNTPLAVLLASKVINILTLSHSSPSPIILNFPTSFSIYLYGSNWGETIPDILPEKHFSILVTHRMVIKDKKLWKGQEEFEYANNLLRKTKFDLIITGDNHENFILQDTNKPYHRFIVNCGSLMRTAINQSEQQPCFYIYSINYETNNTLVRYFVPIEPFDKVFNMEEVEKEKEVNEELELFVKGLIDTGVGGINFVENLRKSIKENKLEEGILRIIQEVMKWEK